jgi:hypothetical protein
MEKRCTVTVPLRLTAPPERAPKKTPGIAPAFQLLRPGSSRFDLLLAFGGDRAKLNQRRGKLVKQPLQLCQVG